MSQLSFEDLVLQGIEAREQHEKSQWQLGDLALAVDTQYGEHTLEDYATRIGVEYSTLRDYRHVAGAYQIVDRSTKLSWTYYRRVASREDRLEWLKKAAEQGWSVSRMLTELPQEVEIGDKRLAQVERQKAKYEKQRARVDALLAGPIQEVREEFEALARDSLDAEDYEKRISAERKGIARHLGVSLAQRPEDPVVIESRFKKLAGEAAEAVARAHYADEEYEEGESAEPELPQDEEEWESPEADTATSLSKGFSEAPKELDRDPSSSPGQYEKQVAKLMAWGENYGEIEDFARVAKEVRDIARVHRNRCSYKDWVRKSTPRMDQMPLIRDGLKVNIQDVDAAIAYLEEVKEYLSESSGEHHPERMKAVVK